MDRNIIFENGFAAAGSGSYYKIEKDICMILSSENEKYNIKAYCSPTFQGLDSELDLYIREHAAERGLLPGSGYVSGEVLLEFSPDAEDNILVYISAALEFIDELIGKYDMLPACMICHRTSVISMYKKDDGSLIPVCDVCRGEQELLSKHEKIIKDSFDPESLVYKHPILDKGPLKRAVFAGIKGALIGSVAAIICSVLGLTFEIFQHTPWIPGAAAGFITMKEIIKIDYRANRLRGFIASLTAIILMFCFSLINVLLVSRIFNIYINIPSFSVGSFGIIKIAVGLGGFFLAEAIVFFLAAED